MTHTTTPSFRKARPAPNSSTGGWALWMPLRIHRMGTSRAKHRKEAMEVPGAQEAMAGGLHGRGLVPRPGHSSRNPSTPKKMSMGHLGVSGARHRNRTHSNKTVYRTIQTGQNNPQEQEALLGRDWKLRSLQSMTWSQGPSPGCLRNRSHIYDRRGRRHL